MFAAGSIKASKWGYDLYVPPASNKWWSNSITSITSNLGAWSSPTLAPNGRLYCLPQTGTYNTNVNLNGVLVINPGTTKSSIPTSVICNATGSTDRPNFTAFTSSSRYIGKGILAPNGLIYFMPNFYNTHFVILNPDGGPDPDNPTWEVEPLSKIANKTWSTIYPNFSGGVLGQDGYIYLISHNSPVTCRIHPRNTTINGFTPGYDVYQLGYYDATTTAKTFTSASGPFKQPQDYTATTRTNVVTGGDPPIPQITDDNEGYVLDAISHPNGKIYVFPMNTFSESRFVFIIDPQYWGTVREFASLPSLAMDNATGVKGAFRNVFMEKLKPSQDPDTLKMYATFTKNATTTAAQNDSRQKIVEFDPTDNSWSLVGETVPIAGGTNGAYTAASNSFLLPNGIIAAGMGLGSTAIPNSISQVIITGGDVVDNKIPSISKNIVLNTKEALILKNICAVPTFYMGNGSGVPMTSSNNRGKTIISGAAGWAFHLSVKGYHPGIKYFNYDPATDSSMFEIPTDLEDLKTSLWNSYFNKPA